jgi:hypothetical protein
VNPSHLRAVRPKENSENRKGAARSSKSGIRGVYYDQARHKWRAVVTHSGRKISLGRFDSLDAAEAAAKAKRAEIFSISS